MGRIPGHRDGMMGKIPDHSGGLMGVIPDHRDGLMERIPDRALAMGLSMTRSCIYVCMYSALE